MRRGKLKVFLGYAPGVGKTYTMLQEANRMKRRGRDVVIGYFEFHGRVETAEQIGDLPVIPCLELERDGHTFYEMDTEAIIRRRPQLVLVDELAHTNAAGMKNRKRYEDVQELLNAGINVYSTINLQHLDSMCLLVEQITGIKVTETMPDRILDEAEEVVIVDIQPRSLQNRLRRGAIYGEGKVDSALDHFFCMGNLNALRELALRKVADHVDAEETPSALEQREEDNFWHTTERILVAIKATEQSRRLIREGARLNRRLKGDFYVVYVECTHWMRGEDTEAMKKVLEKNFALARQHGAECVVLRGKSVSDELVKFSIEKQITKILVGHTNRSWLARVVRGSTINKVMKKSESVQIIVTPNSYY